MIVGKTTPSQFVEGTMKDALKPEIGDELIIISMKGEPQYDGKKGIVEFIDDAGQIHGTWGGCAIIPEEDSFEIIKKEESL